MEVLGGIPDRYELEIGDIGRLCRNLAWQLGGKAVRTHRTVSSMLLRASQGDEYDVRFL